MTPAPTNFTLKAARESHRKTAATERAASEPEKQTPRFSALLVKEAFKTWADSVGEVREAADFMRYDAADEAERIMAPDAPYFAAFFDQ